MRNIFGTSEGWLTGTPPDETIVIDGFVDALDISNDMINVYESIAAYDVLEAMVSSGIVVTEGSIGEAASKVFNGIKTALQNLWKRIKSFFKSIIDMLKGKKKEKDSGDSGSDNKPKSPTTKRIPSLPGKTENDKPLTPEQKKKQEEHDHHVKMSKLQNQEFDIYSYDKLLYGGGLALAALQAKLVTLEILEYRNGDAEMTSPSMSQEFKDKVLFEMQDKAKINLNGHKVAYNGGEAFREDIKKLLRGEKKKINGAAFKLHWDTYYADLIKGYEQYLQAIDKSFTDAISAVTKLEKEYQEKINEADNTAKRHEEDFKKNLPDKSDEEAKNYGLEYRPNTDYATKYINRAKNFNVLFSLAQQMFVTFGLVYKEIALECDREYTKVRTALGNDGTLYI